MNKTFNINLGGYPFAIDEDAFEYIQNYLETIRRHFSSSEGCEEILYDIEVRMAELFQEHLKGRAIISMKEIDEVIMIMGKPEDFGAEPMQEHQGPYRTKKNNHSIKTGKKFFRDPDDKKVAGVCSGLAAYFGVEDPIWIRVVVGLLAIFSGGIVIVPYFLLWFLVPEAHTAGDKLAMRGEPTTIENIAKVVEDELTDLGDKINEWSKDLGSKKKSNFENPQFVAKNVATGIINIFGNVASTLIGSIRTVLKPIIFVVAVVCLSALGIAWAATFFGISFASPFLKTMGPQSSLLGYLGLGSLYFTLGLPLLGIMIYISRLAFGYRVHKNIKLTFWSIWSLSMLVTSFTAIKTVKEYQSFYEQKSLQNLSINGDDIRIVMPEENIDHSFGIHMGDFFTEKEGKWAVRDVSFSIEKSKDQNVYVEKRISSRGETNEMAKENATFIGNSLTVNNQEINISKYLTFPKGKNFRNQSLHYTIFIPEGKTISFNEHAKERIVESPLLSWNQIYHDLGDLKWTVQGQGLFSSQWNDVHRHVKTLATGTINRMIFDKAFDIVITKSDKTNISIEGNKDKIAQIISQNMGGTFTMSSEIQDNFDDILIKVEIPSLDLIHFDGVKTAKIDGFIQDNLKLISHGTNHYGPDTKIELIGNIKHLDLFMTGDQSLNLIGSGDDLQAHVKDHSKILADKYIVKKVKWIDESQVVSSLNVTDVFECKNLDNILVDIIGNPKRIDL